MSFDLFINDSHSFPDHVLSLLFTFNELNSAVSSRKSVASSTDRISPLMLKNLSTNAIGLLLSILNNLIDSSKVPQSWTSYKVFLNPKYHSNNGLRPISLSSTLCKLVKHIFKNRLDWWIEPNQILPDNLYAFK